MRFFISRQVSAISLLLLSTYPLRAASCREYFSFTHVKKERLDIFLKFTKERHTSCPNFEVMLRLFETSLVLRNGGNFVARRSCAATASSNNSSTTTADKSKYDAMTKELKETDTLLAKLNTESLYSAAACENLRKEMQVSKRNAELQAIESFAKDMLEVCDALQVVVRKVAEYKRHNADIPLSHTAVLVGIELTEDVALKTLKRYGVTKVCTVTGRPFDEKFEEKLFTVPSSTELKEGSVAEVIKDGYLLGGSVLRKAQVAVCEDP